MRWKCLSLSVVVVLAACRATDAVEPPNGAQAVSLIGGPLYPPPLADDERAKREYQLEQARVEAQAKPDDADATIWLGRRLAYLGRFREALETFTRGVEQHPDDARMWRHRGHRWITLREFKRAVGDLERARKLIEGHPDEVEPDGLPNKAGVPLETLNSNIYYHLGLAHYLRGDFDEALDAYRECRRWSKNPDNLCSATHWLVMCALGAKKPELLPELLEPIRPELDVREYRSYFDLCLAYAGELDIEDVYAKAKALGVDSVDFATVGYGAGNWHLCHGNRERALEIFREVTAGAMWPAFGHIASEVELSRAD